MNRTAVLAFLFCIICEPAFAQDDELKAALRRRLEDRAKAIDAEMQLRHMMDTIGDSEAPESLARRAKSQIDLRSPFLKWHARILTQPKILPDEGTLKEVLIEHCKLSNSEVQKLDPLVAKRIETNNQHTLDLFTDVRNETIDLGMVITNYQKLEFKANANCANKSKKYWIQDSSSRLSNWWERSLICRSLPNTSGSLKNNSSKFQRILRCSRNRSLN